MTFRRLLPSAALAAAAFALAAIGLNLGGSAPATAPETTASTQAAPIVEPSPPSAETPAVLHTAVLHTEEQPTPAERRRARLAKLEASIDWHRSQALGTTGGGELIEGVELPREGLHFFTWDPVAWSKPNPPSRRNATDRLIRTILEVARDHRRANPGAPRVAIGDLSRPAGGSFDASHGTLAEFGRGTGTLGHVSHQNGLDVDIYYPRLDRRERAPGTLEEIDLELAQDLVDRFVAAGAEHVFTGPSLSLTGPGGVVAPLERHDDHMHVRLPSRVSRG